LSIGLKLGVSRGAVSGKVSRMGLGWMRPEAEKREPRPSRPRPPRSLPLSHPIIPTIPVERIAPLPKPERIAQVSDVDVVRPRLKTLMELKDSECRWPIGDPKRPDFGFCGAPRVVGPHPYCALHMRMSYAAPRRI